MFIFQCPRCGKSVVVDEDMAGRTKKCPHCKSDIAVPQVPHESQDAPARRKSIVRQLPSGADSKYGWYSLMFALAGLAIYFVRGYAQPIGLAEVRHGRTNLLAAYRSARAQPLRAG